MFNATEMAQLRAEFDLADREGRGVIICADLPDIMMGLVSLYSLAPRVCSCCGYSSPVDLTNSMCFIFLTAYLGGTS